MGSALGGFKAEASSKLDELWQSSEVPLPSKLLQELHRDGYFWTELLEDWLLSLSSDSEPLPGVHTASQGMQCKRLARVRS